MFFMFIFYAPERFSELQPFITIDEQFQTEAAITARVLCVSYVLFGVSDVASFITTTNSYNKTQAAFFPCRLCFLSTSRFPKTLRLI